MIRIKSLAAWVTWPVLLVGQIVAFDRALALGFDPGLTLLAITVVNMALIALLELCLPDRPEWRWTRDGPANLSPLTMWCDHLFGTFRHPLDEPLHEVGITPDPIPRNLPAQLASPILWPLLAARRIAKARAAQTLGDLA